MKELSTMSVRRSISNKSPQRLKVTTDVRRTNSFSLLARPSRPGDRLTVEVLQALTPYKKGRDIVSEASRDLLLNFIRMESHVHETFFPDATLDNRLLHVDTRGFPSNKLATALVSEVLSKSKDQYKFHQMINKSALEEMLRDIYNSIHWKKLGFCLYTHLYPEVVKDDKSGVSLADFMENNGHVWAEKLVSHIMEPKWTTIWMNKIIRGQCSEEDYNTEMNALFVKLHLLDPQSVIPAFQFLLNQRALPSVNLELATRNYLGGPLDSSLIEAEVREATRKTSVPLNVSRLSLNDVEVYHGVEVDEFIVTECRNIGVWSGKRADNSRTSKISDRCSVM